MSDDAFDRCRLMDELGLGGEVVDRLLVLGGRAGLDGQPVLLIDELEHLLPDLDAITEAIRHGK